MGGRINLGIFGSFDLKLEVIVPFLRVKSVFRTISLSPPTSIISQMTSNQNLETAIVFIVFDGSRNYFFEENTPTPTALRARVVSYALGAHKVFIELMVIYTLERTHCIGNQNF